MQINATGRAIRAARSIASFLAAHKLGQENAESKNAKVKRLENILGESARTGKTKRIMRLLKAGIGIESRSIAGTTPLMFASSNGRTETVSMLLERGAKINARNDQGITALMLAFAHGNARTFALLLSKGANFKGNARREYWQTTRRHMITRGYRGVVAIMDAIKPLESLIGIGHKRFILDFAECAGL
jgi:ankyrin repeat protein